MRDKGFDGRRRSKTREREKRGEGVGIVTVFTSG